MKFFSNISKNICSISNNITKFYYWPSSFLNELPAALWGGTKCTHSFILFSHCWNGMTRKDKCNRSPVSGRNCGISGFPIRKRRLKKLPRGQKKNFIVFLRHKFCSSLDMYTVMQLYFMTSLSIVWKDINSMMKYSSNWKMQTIWIKIIYITVTLFSLAYLSYTYWISYTYIQQKPTKTIFWG